MLHGKSVPVSLIVTEKQHSDLNADQERQQQYSLGRLQALFSRCTRQSGNSHWDLMQISRSMSRLQYETTSTRTACIWKTLCSGTRYSVGMIDPFKLLHDEACPVFGEMMHIISYPSENVYLKLKLFETVGFDAHYHRSR